MNHFLGGPKVKQDFEKFNWGPGVNCLTSGNLYSSMLIVLG